MSSEWHSYRLDEIGRIVTGKTPKSGIAEFVGNDVPFVTPPDFEGKKWICQTTRRISAAAAQSVKNNIIPARSVLVTCIGSDMGKAALIESESVTNQQINAVVVDETKFCPEFLYYNLALRKIEIRNLAGGSAQPILNKTAFGQLRVDCPSLLEQKALVELLYPLDDRISLLRETNATLQAIAQALFKSWFVDFDPVRAKAEGFEPEGMDAATAALFPDSFEDSELGLMPRGWSIKLCQDLIDVRDGTHASPKPSDTGYPLITSRHITSGEILLDDAYLISNADYVEISRRSRVDRLDILITMIGTVGIPAFVLDEPTEFAIKNIGLFKSSKKPEFSCYLYLLLKSPGMQCYLEARVAGTTQKYLSLKALREISVLEPSAKVIDAFSEIVSPIFTKVHQNNTQVKNLSELRDTLLPRLISGQLRLPEAEAMVEGICA